MKLETDRDNEGILTRNEAENLQIIYVPGLSTAYPENPNRPRKRESYLAKVLNPMIERGEVGDGISTRFDDRKFRFDGITKVGTYDPIKDAWVGVDDTIAIKLGITHYAECGDCRKWDEEMRGKMMEKGTKMFKDPHAFFTRGCGIAVTPITAEGHIFAGKRQPEDSAVYSGELGAVNGWVDYKDNLSNVDFRKNVLKESGEEFGIQVRDITRLIFCGVSPSPGNSDMDFVYLAPLKIGDEEFLERYKSRKDKEHGKLIRISSYNDAQGLLKTGMLPGSKEKFNIVYNLRTSLEQIRLGEMDD